MDQPSQEPGAPTDAGQPGLEPSEPTDAPPEPQDVASLPEWAQKLISKGRTKEADYRTKYQSAQQQAQEAAAQRDKVMAALGLNADGSEAVDPDKLGAQLADVQSKQWETAVENRVLRMSMKPNAGFDADGVLDSHAFTDALVEAGIDHEAADFGQRLEAVVAQFVTDNPRFRSQQAPGAPRGGGDFGGGPNLPPASLDAQIADAEKRRDFNTVIALKRLQAARN
ncbi:MAG TPA: hypothetical protein VGF17_07940 [Phytomonospora sp.]